MLIFIPECVVDSGRFDTVRHSGSCQYCGLYQVIVIALLYPHNDNDASEPQNKLANGICVQVAQEHLLALHGLRVSGNRRSRTRSSLRYRRALARSYM